jgi:hypothetical protein
MRASSTFVAKAETLKPFGRRRLAASSALKGRSSGRKTSRSTEEPASMAVGVVPPAAGVTALAPAATPAFVTLGPGVPTGKTVSSSLSHPSPNRHRRTEDPSRGDGGDQRPLVGRRSLLVKLKREERRGAWGAVQKRRVTTISI